MPPQDNIMTPDAPNFTPARILEIELSQPLSGFAAIDEKNGQRYQRALVLVKIHACPIGVVELPLGEQGASPSECATLIWRELSTEINEHLRHDNLPTIDNLPSDGLVADLSNTPNCRQAYQQAIEAATPISVVIATVNRLDSLKICIESLLAQDYPNFDIIVVDNAPHLGVTSAFIAETYGHVPNIRCVSEKNPGLAQAHNRGLAEVTHPIVVFTDDDVIVDRHWLGEIAKCFMISDDVGCVTGMIFAAEIETPPQEWIEQYGGFGKGYAQRIFDLDEHRDSNFLYPYTSGVFGSGANMSFRTAVIRKVNGFDPALGAGSVAMGGDDLAAFFSIIVAGYKIVYEPRAFLYHMHRREYAGLRRQAYGYGVGLAAYLTSAIAFHPSLWLNLLVRVPGGLLYLFNPKSSKNAGKTTNYPKELTRIERLGFFYGTWAYMKSRWRTRHWKREIYPSTEKRGVASS